MNELLIAAVIGVAFGAALDRVGAATPNILLRMLSLRDLALAKTILLGIGTASALMFLGQMIGVVDVGNMSVKATFLGVFIGGLIFGVGWALSGFCPGTGIASLGSLRKDALSFVLGGLVGAFLYMLTYPLWESAGLVDGDKTTVGTIEGIKAEGLLSVPGDVVGLVLGVVMIAIAFVLPRFPRGVDAAVDLTFHSPDTGRHDSDRHPVTTR